MKMKNGLKKLFAVCLALSMVLGISVPTVANAEETTPVIEVNNVPEAVIGEMSENKDVDVPEGAKYTATVQWYTLEVWKGAPVISSFSGTFENKVTYVRRLIVTATTEWEGWEHVNEYGDVSVDVVINGEYAGNGWFYEGNNSKMHYETYFNFTEEITSVEITGVMDAVVDAQATTEDIEVPEDANYSVEAQWYTYSDSDGYNEFTGIFEKGKKYNIELCVIPKEGYSFSDDCIATVNGEEQDFNLSIAGALLDINIVYSLLEKIDKIEIDNKLPDAVEGQDAEAGVLEVPDGAKYSASYAWYYDDLNNPFTGEFEDGKAYMLVVVVQPAEGYEFAEDVEVTIVGEAVDTPFVTNVGYFYVIMETHDLIVTDNNQNNNNQNNNQNNNNSNNNTQNNSNQNTTIKPSPATGDNASMTLWIALAVIAMAGMAVVVSKKRYEV